MHQLQLLGIGLPGPPEWLVILFVALLIFGRRLPSLMRSLGGSVREFKKGMDREGDDDSERDDRSVPASGGVQREDAEGSATAALDGDDATAADRNDEAKPSENRDEGDAGTARS